MTEPRIRSSHRSGVRSLLLWIGLIATSSVLATACGTKTNAQPAPVATAQTEDIASLPTSFADEFDQPKLSDEWTAISRGPDTSGGEAQCYLPSNVTASDGSLHITSRQDKAGCRNLGGYQFSSGMVQWRSLNFTYGNLKVRAKQPGGKGRQPAIWLLGSDCQATNPTTADNVGQCDWPQAGSDEIDVAEFVDSNYLQINQQIHTAGSNQGCRPAISDASREWHTYELEWRRGSLRWLVDGKVTCEIKNGVPSTPMFLIINIGAGDAAGPVDPQSLPASMLVDYVRLSP